MPLIDLKTNLKDLKFGKDQYRGGNSGQPFVSTRIPATNEPLQTSIAISGPDLASTVGSLLFSAGAGAAIGTFLGPGGTATGAAVGAAVGLGIGILDNTNQGSPISVKFPAAGTGGPDFLLRGGSLVANYVADDYNRLSQFFKSTNGTLFTIKQNLLSRLGTRAQGSPILVNERLYAPLSTILGAVGSPFGLHVNKQGLNPFQGIGEDYTPDRYFTAVSNEIKEYAINSSYELNKLTALYQYKITNDPNLYANSRAIKIYSIADSTTVLLQYGGGPGSFLGIGNTNINFATDNTGAPLKVSNAVNDITLDHQEIDLTFLESNGGAMTVSPVTKEGYFSYSPQTVDFRVNLKKVISEAPSYDSGFNKTLETRTNLGDPGNFFGGKKKTINYTNGYNDNIDISYGAASPNSYDKINALPIYRYDSLQTNVNNPSSYSDLVNFRIGVISNNNIATNTGNIDYIHFRAFLDKITDSYKADWKDIKYIGRGENFYSYSGFDRKVSLSWTVAAQSKAELIPMYKKLNYLASLCMPDYSEYGFMRGNIIKLTIGGYFYEQPGIITGLSYDMNDDDSSWEIGLDYKGDTDDSVRQLPHIIKVSGFEFIPIHTFVPRKQQLTFDQKDNKGNIIGNQGPGVVSSYGKERYIALDGDNLGSLYDKPSLTSIVNFNSTQQDQTLFDKFSTGLPLPEET